MCAQVVEIGDFRLKRERRMLLEGCQHKHLTLDDEGGIVTCDDCQKQVDNYAALRGRSNTGLGVFGETK